MLLKKLQFFSISLVFPMLVGLAVVPSGSTVFAEQSQKAHFLTDPTSNQTNNDLANTIGAATNSSLLKAGNFAANTAALNAKVLQLTPSVAHKEVISAINQAQAHKRVYEQIHIGEQSGPWRIMRGTVNSVPEIHTELSATNPHKHEIAIILPDTGKIYDGVIAFSASTDVAPATLIVPVNSTEIKGQLAAAMDGKKIYAITTEDHEQKIGTWPFAGNVLTIHNNKPIPFKVDYTVIYRELEPSKNNKIGTIQSIPSTLLGNTSEQLAVIIPPSPTNQYSGRLSYTASQNIQLVVFHGPLGSGEGKGQRIWSPDNGKTRYALTDIDLGNNMGNLVFAGNGLVMRSSSDKPFAVSYAVVSNG
jgi:hypothetical protein